MKRFRSSYQYTKSNDQSRPAISPSFRQDSDALEFILYYGVQQNRCAFNDFRHVGDNGMVTVNRFYAIKCKADAHYYKTIPFTFFDDPLKLGYC